MTNLLQDLRFALRQMRRAPGFALAAILILGLGIAANVIVFGVLQALILQPLDVPRPDRVLTFAPRPGSYPVAAFAEVRDVRDADTVFSGVAAEAISIFALEANGVTHPAWGNEVSGQYFEVMGVQPFLGRLLNRADDDHPGAAEVAVLSWPAWKNSFAADPQIVGKIIRLGKHPYTIVGVTPEGFCGTVKFLQPELFVPMANQASLDGVDWLENRLSKNVFPIVRLKDGVTRAQAQQELNAIAARIRHEHPREEDGLAFWLAPSGLIGDFLGAPARRFMAGIMLLAGIVLLAACANLGSLFAARTADRTREIAIRLAIGSTRWRIVRQILLEALVIALLGGACACALAWTTLTGLAQWHPPTDYPMRFLVYPQPSLIVMAFLTSVFAGMVFGVMPLRAIFRADPNDAIKSGASQSAPGKGWRTRWSLRDVLLAAQIALCCVTVTAAFVSLRGLRRTLTMQLGFNPANATLTKFDLASAGYTGAAAEQLQRKILDTVTRLPGVQAAAYADTTPLAETQTIPVYTQQTSDFRPSNKAFDTFLYNVSPGYLKTAETPLLEGRNLRLSDSQDVPRVAVVNRLFAQHLFGTEHAIGRYFRNSAGVPVQVVGLVADGKYFLPSEDPSEAVFLPLLQNPSASVSLVVRTRPDASGVTATAMAATVRKTVHDFDPAILIRLSDTWQGTLRLSFFPSEVATVTLGLFGAFGLLLSIAGTFGLASHTVSKRLRELSIRVALGAQAKQVLSAALGSMLVLLATGSAVGMLLGLATSQVLSHIVYQASARDPLVLAAVAFTILFTGMLAVAGPVRRALQVDPGTLLREQ